VQDAPRFVAVAVCIVEGALLAALTAVQVVALVADRSLVAVPVALFFGVSAGAVWWCARGLALAESWSRGPLVATQLLMLALTWSYHRPYPVAAALLAVAACAALAGLVSPSTTRSLGGEQR